MATYDQRYATDRHEFKEIAFESLMQRRIIEVLLVCPKYDLFMLEEDGRVEEQIFQEYIGFGLHYPPRITNVTTPEDALRMLALRSFHLVIVMLDISEDEAFELGKRLKRQQPSLNLVLLSRRSREITLRDETADEGPFDHRFLWLGDANLLLVIMKLVEDKLNAPHDVREVGVPVIILVEDSVRYYSTYLPLLYSVLIDQSRALVREGLNEHQQTMLRRGRPKVLLATNYEAALELFEAYQGDLLGVISDRAFPRAGERDENAGVHLCRYIHGVEPDVPLLLQSADRDLGPEGGEIGALFLHKQSPTLHEELRSYIKLSYGFGDFLFGLPDGTHSGESATDLRDLQHKLARLPKSSLRYHATNHHFTRWLKARALYSLAEVFEWCSVEQFRNIEELRSFMVDAIKNFRMHMGRGTIGQYDKDRFDEFSVLQRIGGGSIGGKARGLAFASSILKKNRLMFRYDRTAVQIPKTMILSTEVFDRFMEDNELRDLALSNVSDEVLLQQFTQASLPEDVREDLRSILTVITNPVAVRSSSLLEDSQHHPFAGVYSTYFVPNSAPSLPRRLNDLELAIKGVYASTYFRDSRAYAIGTHNLLDEEKMAVVLQETTGRRRNNHYYPSFSGVARSINFYPVGKERPEDGVVQVALGLGRTIVENGTSLRFSPRSPRRLMQLSNVDLALQTTQQQLYAINLAPRSFCISTDEANNLDLLDLQEEAVNGSLELMLSTYSHREHRLREDPKLIGRRVATFAPILKYDMYPLTQIVCDLLKVFEQELGFPVEIEFAVELDSLLEPGKIFKVLQVRPISQGPGDEHVSVDKISRSSSVVTATTALGNGVYSGIRDVVYVRPEAFDRSNTVALVDELARLNKQLLAEDRQYVLIGPGRWGSSDPWLGIPVKWANISAARIIVEVGSRSFLVDPSQGSHFFQNLTMFHAAYLTINPDHDDGSLDVDWLDSQPALYESTHMRHLRFDSELVTKIDGRRFGDELKAVVLKPKPDERGA